MKAGLPAHSVSASHNTVEVTCESWPGLIPVVGTGVDPVTSRFQIGMQRKTIPAADQLEEAKRQANPRISSLRLSSASCRVSALFRVRVGTLWARSLTDPKHLTSKNAQDGSHEVAEALFQMARQYKVPIERSVARGDGSVSG